MIRVDEIWLATEPMDMRAGPDTTLARVIKVFGEARPHCAYLFTNKRGNRMKVLVHDGLGIWLCARCLNQGKFHWVEAWRGDHRVLTTDSTGTGTPLAVRRCRRCHYPDLRLHPW